LLCYAFPEDAQIFEKPGTRSNRFSAEIKVASSAKSTTYAFLGVLWAMYEATGDSCV
jgi:hypothetical protein